LFSVDGHRWGDDFSGSLIDSFSVCLRDLVAYLALEFFQRCGSIRQFDETVASLIYHLCFGLQPCRNNGARWAFRGHRQFYSKLICAAVTEAANRSIAS
jgi:hypothetical protein